MGSSKINRKSVGEGENEGRRDVCGQRTRMKTGDDREHCSNACNRNSWQENACKYQM